MGLWSIEGSNPSLSASFKIKITTPVLTEHFRNMTSASPGGARTDYPERCSGNGERRPLACGVRRPAEHIRRHRLEKPKGVPCHTTRWSSPNRRRQHVGRALSPVNGIAPDYYRRFCVTESARIFSGRPIWFRRCVRSGHQGTARRGCRCWVWFRKTRRSRRVFRCRQVCGRTTTDSEGIRC